MAATGYVLTDKQMDTIHRGLESELGDRLAKSEKDVLKDNADTILKSICLSTEKA